MKNVKRAVLNAIWASGGQLRRQRLEAPKEFQGVEITSYKNGASAAASISADFELCWAWRGLSAMDCRRRGEIERANVPLILGMLENAEVPITWSTVGHLFLDSCDRSHGGLPHDKMPRPPKNDMWAGDWYHHDPCSNLALAPGWYAPDLIQLIQSSKVPHEFGTHSFSHIDFSRDTSSSELVRSEIEASAAAMSRFGLKPRSLVFCYNRMGHHHLDLLYELGIVVVRHRDTRFRLFRPERTSSGVYKVYESMNLRLGKWYDYPEKADIFLDHAVRDGSCFHLWFHPSDHPLVFEKSFEPIIRNIASRHRKNQVWVATMIELAAYREARESMQIHVTRSANLQTLQLSCPLDTTRFGNPEVTLRISSQRAPQRIMASENNSSCQPTNIPFSFDSARNTLTFNVRSSCRKVEVEWLGVPISSASA